MHKKLWRMFALKRNSTLQIMDVQNNSLLWLLWIKNWNLLANWRSTLDLLKRKGWKILNKCYMCKEEEKTVEHILLQGSKAVILWQLIYALFGVQRAMHSLVKCAFWACTGPLSKRREKRLGKLLHYACYRPFQERETGKLLKIVKKWVKQLNIHFCKCCWNG